VTATAASVWSPANLTGRAALEKANVHFKLRYSVVASKSSCCHVFDAELYPCLHRITSDSAVQLVYRYSGTIAAAR